MAAKLIGTECKFAQAFTSDEHDVDYVYTKLVDHYDDGTQKRRTDIVYNYERPFWIVKEGERDYKQKKAVIETERCELFRARQRDLPKALTRALRIPRSQSWLSRLLDNPYVFGAEIAPETFIKQKYKDQYPDCVSASTVGLFDTETCMTDNKRKDELIILTYFFEDTIWCGVQKEFIKEVPNAMQRMESRLWDELELERRRLRQDAKADNPDITEEKLDKLYPKRKYRLETYVADTPGQIAARFLTKAKEDAPDWLAAWNLGFDMKVLLKALGEENYDIAALVSDDIVPPELRHFHYKEGKKVKKIKSGTVEQSLSPEDQWHTVLATAPFQMICQMATFNLLRCNVKGKELSYRLDYILNKNGCGGKFYMDASKCEPNTPEYHRDMQLNYPLEYMVYACGDVIKPGQLDQVLKDLAFTLNTFLKSSTLQEFESNPSKLSNSMFFNRLKKGQVMGCVGTGMEHEDDKLLYSKSDWIVTLPSFQIDRIGLKVCEGLPGIQSQFVYYVSDLDCISSYPRTMWACNMSQETTRLELAGVKGVDETITRHAGINLTGGKANAWEICHTMMGFPGPDELLEDFKKEKGIA